MKEIILRGRNIGSIGSFTVPLRRLTVVTGGSGAGKSLLARSAAFMANAGALLDESLTCSAISEHFDLVERVIRRIDGSALSEEGKEALLDILEAEGLYEENIGAFREKGFITDDEAERFGSALDDDWTEWHRGDDGVLSSLKEETVKDAVLANFPGLFHDGYDGGRGEHSLTLSAPEGDIEVSFDGEGELTSFFLPFTGNAVFLSEQPLCGGPYPDEDSFPYDYESVRDRMYFSLVNHSDSPQEDPEREFFEKLDSVTEDLLRATVGGSVDYDPEEMEFTYTRERDDAKFYLEDMSRGMEVIADIALMVKKRQIHEDSMIVLDSVDSALDSSWKAELAVWIDGVLSLGPRFLVTTRTGFSEEIRSRLSGAPLSETAFLRAECGPEGTVFSGE